MYDYHHLIHQKKQKKTGKTLWIVLFITLFFTIVEVVGGIISNSLALLSDSAHMTTDVLALSLSMTAIYLSRRKSNSTFTFGYLRFEIIASFLNGLLLMIISLGIFIEGIRRMFFPQEIDIRLMLIIASIGLVVNIILTTVLSRSMKEEENLNIQSALWHFIGDLISSIGVIISGIIIFFTGILLFDSLISLVIGTIIFIGGSRILRASYLILMESVPSKFNLDKIRSEIAAVEGVIDVHEMHLWAISSNHYSLTAHVFIDETVQPFNVTLAVNEVLKTKYDIIHSTIQIENAQIHPHGEYGEAFLQNNTKF